MASYLFGIGCALTLLASWGSAGEFSELKAGIPENLPEVHLENGKLISPHASLRQLHCIEENLPYAIRWEAYPAARLMHVLQSGSVDFALPLSVSPERDADFGKFIHLGTNSDLLVRLEQLPGENKDTVVGAMRGTIQAQIAQERGFGVMKVNEIDVLIKLLRAKRVDAIILTEKYFNANAQTWVEPVHSTLFRTELFGIYFSKSVAKKVVDDFALVAHLCRNAAQMKTIATD
ncbi:transporter substrate-binding domain-containing protein [Simiduia curdlanivorans]|uniref:Substrate-binding periplasmic protein n=1 Tax=Simiduia curdlanivorans TaxID=1492769 RepID=A0ABV8V3L2_9GAMM|nr:transporter substrate-binding domain-containing protein [Simiduia curdlanivorans]MDN3638275.1 transporter substrate-binding domain-containing protein [Simiduia curdlanivorans]